MSWRTRKALNAAPGTGERPRTPVRARALGPAGSRGNATNLRLILVSSP
jgi:hypothetical protein